MKRHLKQEWISIVTAAVLGVCGKCRISLVKGEEFLSPPAQTEKKLLKKEEIEAGVRLARCAKVMGSGTIHVDDTVGASGNQILEGTSERVISHWGL